MQGMSEKSFKLKIFSSIKIFQKCKNQQVLADVVPGGVVGHVVNCTWRLSISTRECNKACLRKEKSSKKVLVITSYILLVHQNGVSPGDVPDNGDIVYIARAVFITVRSTGASLSKRLFLRFKIIDISCKVGCWREDSRREDWPCSFRTRHDRPRNERSIP